VLPRSRTVSRVGIHFGVDGRQLPFAWAAHREKECAEKDEKDKEKLVILRF
jgi:hypothetical protein